MANSSWLAICAARAVAGAAVAFGLHLGISDAALAPQGKQAQGQAQQQQQQQQSAWVKLCEKAPLATRDKEGKLVREEKEICLTHHERLDGNTGMVIVSAAIRHVEGIDKEHLMVMVPLGMAIPPGVRAAVYTPEQWEKAQKNEKIDEKELKPISLNYTLCHPAGCTAEVEATKELLDSMKTGGGLMVLAINANGQPIAFPVPLDGFTAAHNGPPVDSEAYAKARSQLMEQIRERRAELIRQAQEKQAAEKQGSEKGAAEKKAAEKKK
nr:MAG: invasion protein [Pseudomonadota bacterium]